MLLSVAFSSSSEMKKGEETCQKSTERNNNKPTGHQVLLTELPAKNPFATAPLFSFLRLFSRIISQNELDGERQQKEDE